MTCVDTHAHLDDEQFDRDRDEVVARALQAGVEAIISVGVTADSSEAAVRLAQRYKTVFAAVGIQPNYAAEAGPRDWDRIVSLADDCRVVALGETGLDRHWDFTPFETQQDYFDRHLRLAQDRDLPVIVHSRNTDGDVTAMLRAAADRGKIRGKIRGEIRGAIHSFSGSTEMAADCLAMGLFISFSGMVTYRNKKFRPLRAVAAEIPDNRLLVETDSPYLVPDPLRGKQKRNEPARVIHTIESLAELRGRGLDELAAQTTANARELFRLG